MTPSARSREQPRQSAALASTFRTRLPQLTDRVALGRSGLHVSPCCVGIVDDPAIIALAFEAGINFFFLTGDLHWPYYEGTRVGLARLLSSRPEARREIVVAVASYVTQPEFFRAPFQEVLEVVPELLDYLDVAVIGGAYPNDFFSRLTEYQKGVPGRTRAMGATFHDRRSAVTAVNGALVDIAFVRYNAAHPGAEDDVLPHLHADRTTNLFSFKSAAGYVGPERLLELGVPQDRWRPEWTDHYRFALSRFGVDGILCALGQVEHVAELSASLAKGPLSPEEADYLKKLSGLDTGEALGIDPA